MSLYIVEEKLTTSKEEKLTSLGLALIITAAIMVLMYFIRIVVPDPPFEAKQGVVELDFGMVEPPPGSVDQGGPSETPPAAGGGDNVGTNSPQAGGYGPVVNTDASDADQHLPEITPPSSTNPGDPRTARQGRIGQRGDATTGTTSGLPGGRGTSGSGGGVNTGGVRGGGNGLYSYDFTHYKLSTTVNKVDADGEGIIICRVNVDCAGRVSVTEYGARGTEYTGSASNLRKVFDYFLSHSSFTKTSDKCGESGLITLKVKRTI